MFGYIVVNKPELKIKEMDVYQSYYCGLCKALKCRGGRKAQISLNYDFTFLILLLSGLYEPEEEVRRDRCMLHPLEKHCVRENDLFSYVADMTLLLSWYKCKDDYADESSKTRACYAKCIEKQVREIEKIYNRQGQAVKKYMNRLTELEQESETDLDALSGCFGHLLEQIFIMKEDEWKTGLGRMGFYLGKYIYILDAYDDLEKDQKKQCFNPFIERSGQEGFDEYVRQLLQMAATEAAREFEKMPILRNAEILRNILYSGMWTQFEKVRLRRKEERK